MYTKFLTAIIMIFAANARSLSRKVPDSIDQKDETSSQPLLYNLPELQNFITTMINVDYFKAASEGNLELVKEMINDNRVYVNASNNKAFINAAMNGQTHVIDYFLSLNDSYGVNPFARYNMALKYSASEGHLDVVERILNIPIETRAKFLKDESKWVISLDKALEGAAENGRVNVVRLLLDYGATPSLRTILFAFEMYTEHEREKEILQVSRDKLSKKIIGKYTDAERNQVLDHILNFLSSSNYDDNNQKVQDYKQILDLLILKVQENQENIINVFEFARIKESGLYDLLLNMPQINKDIKRMFQGRRVRFRIEK